MEKENCMREEKENRDESITLQSVEIAHAPSFQRFFPIRNERLGFKIQLQNSSLSDVCYAITKITDLFRDLDTIGVHQSPMYAACPTK